MQGNPKVIDALNAGLTLELTAINQYFIQAKMCLNWGLRTLGNKHYKESMEEMQHAEKLIDHILFLDGVPEIARYDVIRAGTNVKEQFDYDMELEVNACKVYNEGIKVCLDANDAGSRQVLEELLTESEHHVDWLESQLDLIENLGLENYLVTQVGDQPE